MIWARIENQKVIEVTDIDPKGRFHPDIIWVQTENENVSQHWRYLDGVFVEPEKTPLFDLAEFIKQRIDGVYREKIGAIVSAYTEQERATWGVQLEEAKDFESQGAKAVTPWLDACARQRGLERAELVEKILEKDRVFRGISGFFTGVRQWHYDCIDMLLDDGEGARQELEAYDISQGWEPEQEQEQEQEQPSIAGTGTGTQE